MKMIISILLCSMMSIYSIHSYPDQKCYICETNSCIHPATSDIQHCSDSTNNNNQENSGKTFVNGAFNGTDSSSIYDFIATDLFNFGAEKLGLNGSAMPSWESLTRWVCYVSKDKRRGCLIMAKGLCSENKSWLAKVTDLGDKISSIVAKAKNAIDKMFTDTSNSTSLTVIQKQNISNWFAENYMSKLVSNSKNPQYQLDTCCEGDACNNFAMTIQQPAVTVILFFLSMLILV